MDFGVFDSRGAADKGRPLHLLHPSSALPLYNSADRPFEDNGLPCTVLVRGTEGRDTQRAVTDVLKRIREAKDEAAPEDEGEGKKLSQSREELHDELVRLAIPLVAGFENVDRGDSPARVPEDVEWFLNLQLSSGAPGLFGNSEGRSFVEQVVDYSVNRAHYLGNGPSVS